MRTLEQQMAVYQRYHRDARNKATHFIGVPLVVFSILIPMSWTRVEVGQVHITMAEVFVLIVMAYYFALDRLLAAAMAPCIGLLLFAADAIASRGYSLGLECFGICFVAGWVFQLVGHVFEGRKPALVDNFSQIFIAPIFLMAEVFFALGLKRDVLNRIEALTAAGS